MHDVTLTEFLNT